MEIIAAGLYDVVMCMTQCKVQGSSPCWKHTCEFYDPVHSETHRKRREQLSSYAKLQVRSNEITVTFVLYL